jgi:hypothetical protein
MKLTRIAAGLGLALVACSGDTTNAIDRTPGQGGSTESADVSLDPGIQYQTMLGWEGSSDIGQDHSNYLQWRDSVIARAVNDLGLNRIRLEVRSGAENTRDWYSEFQSGQIPIDQWRCVRYAPVNDNADPASINQAGFVWTELDEKTREVVVPMKAALAARGERLIVNLNFVAFDKQRCQPSPLVHDSPAEYAEFVLATVEHLDKTFNIVPDAWEVILEPDNTTFWRGKQIGDAIVASAALLEQHGYGKVQFVAPSTTNMSTALAYVDAMSQVPGAMQHVAEISYHRYSGVSVSSLQQLASKAESYHVGIGMLEHIGSGYADLHQDLELGQNSSWQQFTIAYPSATDNGGSYFRVVLNDQSGPKVVPGSRTPALRQYFKYIRLGAVRIDAISRNAAVDPLAFLNTDLTFVVVLKCARATTAHVGDLPPGVYGIYYTTDEESSVDLPDVQIRAGETVEATIPGAGVITVYGKGVGPS